MGHLSLAYSVDVESVQCASCHVIFGMPISMTRELRRNHKSFYCPAGHSQHWPGESDVEKAERLLREEKERHQRTIARENEERAAKDKAERKLKRVSKGVCPECKRTFPNLAKHMACKHKLPPIFTKKKRGYTPESG